MHNPKTHKRTERWSATQIVAVIITALLLFAVSFMAYSAIDTQASRATMQG